MFEEYVWPDAPDFQDPATTQNLDHALQKMLDYGKPYYVPKEQAWYIVRHEDIESVFRDKTTSSDRLSGYFGRLPPDKQAILEPLFNDLKRWLIFVDEPDHKRVRSPMQRAFTSSIVKSWDDWLNTCSEKIILKGIENGNFEIMQQLAQPLPLMLICEMLGMPEDDGMEIKGHYEAIGTFIDNSTDPAAAAEALKANGILNNYMQETLSEARNRADLNLLKVLANIQAENRDVSDQDLVVNGVLVLGAGHETTSSHIASTIMMAYEDEELLASVGDSPKVRQALIEESLRLYPPVIRTSRIIQREFNLSGVTIPKDQRCMLMIASGNRDPEVFENPNQIRLDRKKNPHFAFASGTHYCVGANVARLEADITLKHLGRLASDFRLSDEALEWTNNSTFRALKVYV